MSAAGALLGLGHYQTLIAELQALVAANPLHEGFRALLTRALAGSVRPADAFAALRENRRVLADELGIDPSREMHRLEYDLLNRHPLNLVPDQDAPGRPEAGHGNQDGRSPASSAVSDESRLPSVPGYRARRQAGRMPGHRMRKRNWIGP